MANLDGAFATAFGTLVGGAFIIGFVKLCGGGDLWVGVVSALGSLLGIVQIPGAILGRRFKTYKGYVWPGGLAWRLLYLTLIPLPLLAWAGQAKLAFLVGMITIASTVVLMVNPIYNDWLAELIPSQSRGSFFSNRNAITTSVGAVIGIVGGVLLDFMKAHGWERAGYASVFALGSAMGLVSFWFFWQMKDMVRENPVRSSLGQGLRAIATPFRDRNYRPVLVFLVVAIFAQGFPGALFAAYALETLKLPFSVIQLTGACQALGTVLSAGFWGFAVDKYGNRPLLVLACLLLALNPIPWILCRPHALAFDTTLLLTTHVLMGIFWGGINLCQFNIMLSTAPAEDRANYLGAGMAVGALIGGIAPLAGASVMAWLREYQGHAQIAYQTVFGVDIGLRLVATLFLFKVREEGSTRLASAFRQLTSATPTKVRALRKLTRSGDAEQREEALESLSQSSFDMASTEMIRALGDPLPKVRRQAALALARLRDPASLEAAAKALSDQLQLHPELVEEETIEALGTLGEPETAGPLIPLLQSPRTLIRRAAARALGRLGNREAVPALMGAALDGDADIRRSALQALRALEAREAAGVIAAGLMDERASVRVAAAEAVADLELRELRDRLRRAVEVYDSEGASSMAYALGVVGQPADLELILHIAETRQRVVTRRQALLGAARLLGVEEASYHLILLDGMARDQEVADMLRPLTRQNKRIQVALNLFSSGQENDALHAVAKIRPELEPFGSHPVDEAFLVVAAALVKLVPKRKKGPTEQSAP